MAMSTQQMNVTQILLFCLYATTQFTPTPTPKWNTSRCVNAALDPTGGTISKMFNFLFHSMFFSPKSLAYCWFFLYLCPFWSVMLFLLELFHWCFHIFLQSSLSPTLFFFSFFLTVESWALMLAQASDACSALDLLWPSGSFLDLLILESPLLRPCFLRLWIMDLTVVLWSLETSEITLVPFSSCVLFFFNFFKRYFFKSLSLLLLC